jgi:AcrR family transcriptional regulator
VPTTPAKRSYDSSRRALQAAQTRDDVLRAAIGRFPLTGWAGTTLAAIAAEAGVSVETIYNGFGSKKALLRAAIDAAVVGDAEPVPLRERPEYLALAEGSLDERIGRTAALTAAIHERAAGLWQAIVEAASADEEVDRWRLELEQRRRLEVSHAISLVLGRPVDEQVVTILWILFGSEIYLKLVHDAGCTRAEYEAFLVDSAKRLVATT